MQPPFCSARQPIDVATGSYAFDKKTCRGFEYRRPEVQQLCQNKSTLVAKTVRIKRLSEIPEDIESLKLVYSDSRML